MIGNPVLLVEDGGRAHDGELARILRTDGFEVTSVSTVEDCLDQLAAGLPMVVLVDIGYADQVALEVCHQVRRQYSLAMITIADPNSPIDAVTTLEMGADDHVVRPYRTSELIARMRAAARRAHNAPVGLCATDPALIIGRVQLDPVARIVTAGGQPAPLSLKEFDLLHLLMANPGRVLSRDTIIRHVWQREPGSDTSTVDVHVKRLREKLDVAGEPSLIVTIRGLGYRVDRPASAFREGGALALSAEPG